MAKLLSTAAIDGCLRRPGEAAAPGSATRQCDSRRPRPRSRQARRSAADGASIERTAGRGSRRLQRAARRAARRHSASRLVALTQLSERLRGRTQSRPTWCRRSTAHSGDAAAGRGRRATTTTATPLMGAHLSRMRSTPSGTAPGLGARRGRSGQEKRHWTQRFAVAGDADSPVAADRVYPPPRAAWIVRATTPTNVAAIGSAPNGEPVAPAFDDTPIPRADPTTPMTPLPCRTLRRHRPGAAARNFRKWACRSPICWRCRRRSIRCWSTIPTATIRSG